MVAPDPNNNSDKTDRSRTLVNGTCWKFVVRDNAGDAFMPENGQTIRWTRDDLHGGQFSLPGQNTPDGGQWVDTIDTAVGEVWFKAGTATCNIQADLRDANGRLG